MKQEGWGPYWIYILTIRTARKSKLVPQETKKCRKKIKIIAHRDLSTTAYAASNGSLL
jgi:hypothetical protein